MLTDAEMLALAEKEGFAAAFIAPDQIPVDKKFRADPRGGPGDHLHF